MASVGRVRRCVVTALAAALLTAGCGSQESAQPSGTGHRHESAPAPDSEGTGAKDTDSEDAGTHDADMKGMDMGGADTPSEPASMICSAEIQDAVKRTFAMSAVPAKSDTWSKADRVYSCTYRVPGGSLALSVQDRLEPAEGSTYFRGLRQKLAGARTIRGVQSLGFPALETSAGQVAFLKDGKTLVVDASTVQESFLPTGYSASEAAYSVAAAVVACWTE